MAGRLSFSRAGVASIEAWLGTIQGKACLSAALHLVALFIASNAWWMGAHTLRFAGSPHGSRVATLYDPSPASPAKPALSKPAVHRVRMTRTRLVAPDSVPSLEAATAPTSDEVLGSGQVSITYLQAFPAQRPDLTGVGPSGDVELDLQIDETGRIAQIRLRRGMADSVDRMIIATVEQWVFHPAMRNGRPVSSAEELHFHFDRRSPNCGWECFSLEVQ